MSTSWVEDAAVATARVPVWSVGAGVAVIAVVVIGPLGVVLWMVSCAVAWWVRWGPVGQLIAARWRRSRAGRAHATWRKASADAAAARARRTKAAGRTGDTHLDTLLAAGTEAREAAHAARRAAQGARDQFGPRDYVRGVELPPVGSWIAGESVWEVIEHAGDDALLEDLDGRRVMVRGAELAELGEVRAADEFERPTDEGVAPEVDDDSTSPEGGEAAGEAT